MTTAAQLRSRYAREAVTTASPARLVTMLYDRLVRDLDDAELAISLADPQAAHACCGTPRTSSRSSPASLDVSRWEGGDGPADASTPGCSSGSSPPTSPRTPRSWPSAARSSSRCATRGTRLRTSSRSPRRELQLAGHARRVRPAPGPAVPAGGRGPVRRGGRLRAARPTCPRCRGCSSPARPSCCERAAGPGRPGRRPARRDAAASRRPAPAGRSPCPPPSAYLDQRV